MRILPTRIQGLVEIETEPRTDARGRFTRVFCTDEYAAVRPDLRFVQVNHSVTALEGTVRGLHFQRTPKAEAKLIRCIRGAVFDVAVDLRRNSPTFGQWHGVELTEDNERQLFIPEGCAHGFQALTNDTHLLYQHTTAHSAPLEGGVRYDDRTLAIAWPVAVTLVSERDLALPTLDALAAKKAA